MFEPLTMENIKQIVGIQFKMIQKRLEENGIKLESSDEVLIHLGKIGFDPQFGARPLKRVLQKEILNRLSKDILSGKVSKDSVVGMTLNDRNGIEFINLDKVKINE